MLSDSLIAKDFHGVNVCGAQSGNKRRKRGDEQNEAHNARVGDGVERRDAVKHARKEMAEAKPESEACDASEDSHAQTLPEEARDNLTAQRAKSQAHPYFALAQSAQVTQRSIETNARQ